MKITAHNNTCGALVFLWCVIACFPLRVSSISISAASQLHSFPRPEDLECNASNSTRICDPSNVLSESDIASIQDLVHDYEELSILCHGQAIHSQLGVFIVDFEQQRQQNDSISSSTVLLMTNDIKKLARAIRQKWNLGVTSACGNTGVLLYVVIHANGDKSQVYISRGRAMISSLPFVVIQASLEDATSALRQELYRDAIESIITDLSDFLKGHKSVVLMILDRLLYWCFRVLVPLLCCCCLIGVVQVWFTTRRLATLEQQQFDELKRELQQVKENHYLTQRGRYEADSCQICQKDFGCPREEHTSKRTIASEETPLVFGTKQTGADDNSSNLISLISLRCGHEFHSTCILQWMASQRRNYDPCRCPVCMQGI